MLTPLTFVDARRNAVQLLIVFLIPPLAVYRDMGWSGTFWLNLLLTLLGIYPGVIHGVFVVIRNLR